MKILLIGMGAIGGSLAVCIKNAGFDIDVVTRPNLKEKIETEGFKITGILGEKTAAFKAFSSVGGASGKYDYVLIASKAYDMPKLAKECLSLLNDDSLVVSLQNGICLDALSAIVGEDRTVGCVIGYGATLVRAATAEVTSTGELIIGKVTSKYYIEKMPALRDILASCFPVEISNNIYEALYSKLLVNSCITSLGALCGLTLGKMLKKKQIRKVFIDIIKEGMEVADSLNINVPAYGGKLDYYKFVKSSSFKQHLIIFVVGLKYRKLKSSSLQSLERKKPTEIDYFNGYICQKGKEVGVETKVNDKIVEMIKEIETGERKITLDNFKELVF